MFSAVQQQQHIEHPGKPGLLCFLFIKKAQPCPVLSFGIIAVFFLQQCSHGEEDSFQRRKAEEKMVKSVRGRGRMKEGRPAEITTGSIFLPLPL